MADLKQLEKKILELEERVQKLEGKDAWEKDLYKLARNLVVKHKKASAIFLQRKLMIDYERATELVDKLKANGVIDIKPTI